MAIEGRLKRVSLISHVKGEINGVVFDGHGFGAANTQTGESKGQIQFDQFPGDYSPLLCRSWKCKHHKCVAAESGDGGANLFAISEAAQNFYISEVLRYPNGEEIFTYGRVQTIKPDHQVAVHRF